MGNKKAPETPGGQASTWRSMRIAIEPGYEDVIASFIFESGFSGLEEHEAEDCIILTAYYQRLYHSPDPLERLKHNLTEIPALKEEKPYDILSIKNIPDEDWEENWRRGLKAHEIGSRFVVRPSWISYINTDSRFEIIIDPKMAFGTGEHLTTRLCMEMLERMKIKGSSVIDAGCGSGILSIAAVKLGAVNVFGFDNDPFSVENAIENVRLNGVENSITIVEADIMTLTPEPADLVLANMISCILMQGLPRFHGFLKPEGIVVFSGLLAEEETLFTEALEDEDFRVIERTRDKEWIAIKASKNHKRTQIL